MNAATIGLINGPMNTIAEKHAMAIPRVSLPNRSEKAPPTTASGQDANTPAKKRHNMRVWKSFAVAQANMKQVCNFVSGDIESSVVQPTKMKAAIVTGILRP